jgi:hypothetical protein
MTVPYIFANQSGTVPASELDANFASVSENVSTANIVIFGEQTNITTVGTLGNLSVTGNVTANLFIGNIVGEISNAIYANNAGYATSAGFANTATTATVAETAYNAEEVIGSAQGNITSLGTLISLSVTGLVTASQFSGFGNTLSNIQAANISGVVANATYALSANSASYATSAVQSTYANIANAVSGINVTGQVSNALIAGTVYTNAQPNITSVGTLTSISVTGNVRGGNLISVGYLSSANGLESTSTYPGPYTDGVVVDYLTGNARISAGAADGIQFFNGGVANTSLGGFNSSGAFSAIGSISSGATSNISAGNIINNGELFTGSIAAGEDAYVAGNTSTTTLIFNGDSSKFSSAKWTLVETITGNLSAGNASVATTHTFSYYATKYNEVLLLTSAGNIGGGTIVLPVQAVSNNSTWIVNPSLGAVWANTSNASVTLFKNSNYSNALGNVTMTMYVR